MPRNIVICCDGTGNQFGTENSNVVKLYTAIDVKLEQIAYYHPGVGTMGAPNHTSGIREKIAQFTGLAFGAGFQENLAGAYRYLMEEYADGDRVFLFGFSRGAYTVRALAGVLSVYGLLCPGNQGHLDYVLDMYSVASKEAFDQGRHRIPKKPVAEAFKETFSREIPIHFMGLWDTVSSIGWIYDPVKLLYDGRNPIVRTCRHAVSVDERRCFFQDNLWGDPLPPKDTPLLKGYQQDVVQAYFAGVHSDVGGSYPQEECAPALDSLRWMLDEAKQAGLLIHESKRAAVLGEPQTDFPAIGRLCEAPPPMERLHDSLTWRYLPLELLPHKYFDANGKPQIQLVPWAHRREIRDGALLHPSLLHRFAADEKYRPPNLLAKDVALFRDSPIPLPCPEVVEQLAEENFGVYRPGPQAMKPAHTTVKIAAAAVVAIGVAWSLFRRS